MHKASDHNTKRCEVEKWVFLPHSDFERLKANPYNDEGERDSCTLTDEQVDKYIQMFPQSVVEISPEEDIGMTMISF